MTNVRRTYGLLSSYQLREIRDQSVATLETLVKPQGIYASNSGSWNGQFHHYFGRDSAITTMLIYEAEKISKNYQLSETALQALISFANYQGQKDDPVTGEEKGKIPHEINTSKVQIEQLQKQISSGHKSWFIDRDDGYLKNWDSVDATALWLIAISKYIEDGWPMPAHIKDVMAEATRWCVKNIEEFGGYTGWIPAEDQPDRQFGGLTNQAWKDSRSAFEYEKGFRAVYPIHDIFSNAATWAALKYSSKLLYKYDPKLAGEAERTAIGLRWRFNKSKLGFRVKNSGFFAEALDGKLQKLTTPSIDVGMAMDMDFGGKTIFNKKYQKMIVEKLMSGEFFNEKLGLRTYTQYILSYTLEDQYHRGPHTFWPFSGAIVAQGFDRLGFKQEAAQILHSLLLGLSDFESFVELFQLQGDKVTLWNSTETPQTSSLNQAWTAAAAYYAAGYLINAGQTKHHLIIKLIRDAITASSTGLKTIKKPLSKKIKL